MTGDYEDNTTRLCFGHEARCSVLFLLTSRATRLCFGHEGRCSVLFRLMSRGMRFCFGHEGECSVLLFLTSRGTVLFVAFESGKGVAGVVGCQDDVTLYFASECCGRG